MPTAAAVGLTTTVTVALPPTASPLRLQERVPEASAHVPWLVVADTNVSAAGSVSDTVVPVEAFGPLFVAVSV